MYLSKGSIEAKELLERWLEGNCPSHTLSETPATGQQADASPSGQDQEKKRATPSGNTQPRSACFKKAKRDGPAVASGSQLAAEQQSASDLVAHNDNIVPYFQKQDGAWCGMHALNSYKKGDYVQKKDCRLAALQVCKRLSEVHGQDMEELDLNLDPDTGWLSIDVINVLGAANLGIHVDPSPSEVSQDLLEGMSDYLVNCNNMHWTVLRRTAEESWEHINSIVEGGQVHHGQRTVSSQTALLELFGSLKGNTAPFRCIESLLPRKTLGHDSWSDMA